MAINNPRYVNKIRLGDVFLREFKNCDEAIGPYIVYYTPVEQLNETDHRGRQLYKIIRVIIRDELSIYGNCTTIVHMSEGDLCRGHSPGSYGRAALIYRVNQD